MRRDPCVHGKAVDEHDEARLLIENLRRDYPEVELVISSTTLTGFTLAQEQHPELRVIYFPIDFGLFPGRAFDRVRPSCVLLPIFQVITDETVIFSPGWITTGSASVSDWILRAHAAASCSIGGQVL